MNVTKRNNIKLTPSIHTLTERMDYEPIITESVKDCCDSRKNRGNWRVKINPNKAAAATDEDLTKYRNFEKILEGINAEMCVTDYRFSRVDLRLDSYEDEFYDEYEKLFRYLITLIAVDRDNRNSYHTTHLLNFKNLSTAVRNPWQFEIEYYNKTEESAGKDPAKARLELRTKGKGLNCQNIKTAFKDHWVDRMESAISALNIRETEEALNNNLYKKFEEEQRKHGFTIKEFVVVRHQDDIFTRRQLEQLLAKLGAENPITQADSYVRNYKIEVFTEYDMESVVGTLKGILQQYFSD